MAAVVITLWCSMMNAACGTPPAKLYAEKCASCHGAYGEGVEDLYNLPLAGEASLEQLAERIDSTMPEDDPDACVGDEARAVAKYIYGEFYSVDARRAKGLLAAPRVELARLTVAQYRNCVADLLASFTPQPNNNKPNNVEGGLQARYFQSDGMSKTDDLKLERVDGRIDFDFKQGAPTEGIDPTQFAVIWQGSFKTHSTGIHEFHVETPNGVRLYINADSKNRHGKLRDDSSESVEARLIDGWVSSGEHRTLSGKVFLLAGREYPIRIEFFKFLEDASSIRLTWKPPHGVRTVMDAHTLSPLSAPRTYCIDVPFPADDRSVGYERGRSVSPEWYSATTKGAIATADEVLNRLPLLTGAKKPSEQVDRLASFMLEFASTAYRRPLTAAEKELFGEQLFAGDSPESAVRCGVLLVMSSPHFLYTDLPNDDQQVEPYRRAAQLAFTLWDSLPDAVLIEAAKRNRLSTFEELTNQAERMLSDPRAKTKMQGVFSHWLELEERDLAKDATLYPDFNAAIIADLRRSLELFVEQVVWSEKSDYRELLLADYLLLNSRLQTLYGHEANESAEVEPTAAHFVRCDATDDSRCGILTHPYLLSAFAYHNNTSPIHRGVFVTRNIVGRPLKPPPVAVAFKDSEFAPHLTMREKVTELTRDKACMSCHEVINPLGFALENYDAVGRPQSTVGDKPIDTRSDYTALDGSTHAIASARDIAQFAITSPTAHRAFVTQVFHHMVRQPPAGYGPDVLEQLTSDFAASEFNIQRLLVRIAVVAAAHNNSASSSASSTPSE